jgi:hypothetical protein
MFECLRIPFYSHLHLSNNTKMCLKKTNLNKFTDRKQRSLNSFHHAVVDKKSLTPTKIETITKIF